MGQEAYRRLTVSLSILVLSSHLVALYGYRRLPDDPLHLARHLTLYSCFAVVLGAVGWRGARTGQATLVTVFANFLLIDTIVSSVPRLVLITLFPSIRAAMCSQDNIHAWLQTQSGSSALALDEIVQTQMMGQCRKIVGLLQVLGGVFALALSAFQALLALRVSAHARALCKQEDDHERQLHAAVLPQQGWKEKEKLYVAE